MDTSSNNIESTLNYINIINLSNTNYLYFIIFIILSFFYYYQINFVIYFIILIICIIIYQYFNYFNCYFKNILYNYTNKNDDINTNIESIKNIKDFKKSNILFKKNLQKTIQKCLKNSLYKKAHYILEYEKIFNKIEDECISQQNYTNLNRYINQLKELENIINS